MSIDKTKVVCAFALIALVMIFHLVNPAIDGQLDLLAATAAGFLFGSGVVPSK